MKCYVCIIVVIINIIIIMEIAPKQLIFHSAERISPSFNTTLYPLTIPVFLILFITTLIYITHLFICLLISTFPIRNAKSVSTGLGLVLFAHCCISRIQTSSWNIISIQIFFPVSSHTKNLGNVFTETSFFSSQTSLLAIQKHRRNTHY